MDATEYAENNLYGNVFYDKKDGTPKMISTVPLGLSGTKFQGDEPDYYLTTKGYVDDQIEDVKSDISDLEQGLSAAKVRIDSLEAFENSLSITLPESTKPNSDKKATLATVNYTQYLSGGVLAPHNEAIALDLTDFAFNESPTLTGTPILSNTPDKDDDSTKIANTEFVHDVILNKVIGASNYTDPALYTIKMISDALDGDSSFATNVKSSINARLLKSEIDVTVYNGNKDNIKTQLTDGTRDIAVIQLKGSNHTLKAYTGDLAPKNNPTLTGDAYAPSNDDKQTSSPIATRKDIQESVKSIMGVDAGAVPGTIIGGKQYSFPDVQSMAEQVAKNADAINSLESNSQKSSPVLDDIAKISLGSSDDKHVKIIYTNYAQSWLGQNIHNEALSFISAGDKTDMAKYLAVPRITKSTVNGKAQFDVVAGGAAGTNDTISIRWDQLIAGYAIQATQALSAVGDNKSIKNTYATKEEIAALTGGSTAVDKAVKDSSGNVFEEYYLPIASGVTAVSLDSSTTSEKKTQIGTLKVTLGSGSQSSSVSSAFYVDLSNYAKLSLGTDANDSQVFDRRPYIKVNDSLISQAITAAEVANMLGVPVPDGGGSNPSGNSGNPSGATLNLAEVNSAITNINSSISAISSAVTTLQSLQGGKQDSTSLLQKLSKIEGADYIKNTNRILYTALSEGASVNTKDTREFRFTTLTEAARTLLGKSKDDMISYLGIGAAGGESASFKDMAAADYATYDSEDAQKVASLRTAIHDKYIAKTDVYDITGRASEKQPNDLNWSSSVSSTVRPISINTLAFWDGRYDETHSNLRYFKNSGGSTVSFDDMVTNVSLSGSDFWIKQAGKNVWSNVGNTNRTYKFVVGSKASLTSDASVAASVGTVYLNLYDSLEGASPSVTVDSSVAFKAGSNVTISADKNRNITFAAAAATHNTDENRIRYILSKSADSAKLENTIASGADSLKPALTGAINYNPQMYFTPKDGCLVVPYVIAQNLVVTENIVTQNFSSSIAYVTNTVTEHVITKEIYTDSSLSVAGGVGTNTTNITNIINNITDITNTESIAGGIGTSAIVNIVEGGSSTATNISEGAGGILFAVCNTYSEDNAKEITLEGVTKLTNGMHLTVLFKPPLQYADGYTPPSNYQTASLTLQVNGLQVCPIYYNGAQVQQSFLTPQCCYSFVYYEDIWYIIGSAFTLISTNIESNTSS